MVDEDVRVALRCASELLDRRRLQGIPLGGWLVAHHNRMMAMSACGTENEGHHPQLGDEDEPLTTQEVAAMLNTSARYVRRIAPDLGAVKVGRDWNFPRRAVAEHVEGRHK